MLRKFAHFGRLTAEDEHADWRLRKKEPRFCVFWGALLSRACVRV